MLRLFKSNHTLSKTYRAMSAAGLLSALVLLPQTTTAETADTNGTDFWLTFPQNFDGGGAQFSFFLSAAENRTISIEIPGLGFSDSVDVAANVATKYSLPQSVEVMLTDTVVSKGIHVSSLEEFTVYGLSRRIQTTDAYLGLPSDVAGSDYTWQMIVFPRLRFCRLPPLPVSLMALSITTFRAKISLWKPLRYLFRSKWHGS